MVTSDLGACEWIVWDLRRSGLIDAVNIEDARRVAKRLFGEGMLVTAGGFNGGYGLYLLKGKPVFNYNFLMLAQLRCEGQQPLSLGKHTIVFDFTYDGPGVAKGGTGILKVDGADVATLELPHTIPFLLPVAETFDVGVDTRTSVNDKDYQVPFRFTGKIDKLMIAVERPKLTPEDVQKLKSAYRAGQDAN